MPKREIDLLQDRREPCILSLSSRQRHLEVWSQIESFWNFFPNTKYFMLKKAKFLMKTSTNSTSLSFKLRPGISESETAAWRQHTLSTYMDLSGKKFL